MINLAITYQIFPHQEGAHVQYASTHPTAANMAFHGKDFVGDIASVTAQADAYLPTAAREIWLAIEAHMPNVFAEP